jgi:uridine kinase
MKSKLILIGGVSRSGKTTLAKQLSLLLPNTRIISQDDFVLPSSSLPLIRDRYDWDSPESIDWSILYRHITQELTQHEHVILEGIFAYNSQKINRLSDYNIYLSLDQSTFQERRKKETRWGTEPSWYMAHVWNAHIRLANPHGVRIDHKRRYTKELAKELAQILT